ncbi:HAD family hydrolase [Neisseria weaveri]|uniref:Putative HAD-like hydrolase n=1 Tax=Neisseria weaveri TaxID=28091 RepID=A0A3S4YSE4_9NEIS|nr:HAD family hydrolase [Neisseria weaveri]EGV37388.1 putative hydrolase, haloacid dehalogenase-like hydrolase [Neisseria weaveri LMG 5135]SAY50220.1 putative HAD-like hydrolase [Neisseria weaveri]VEJ51625.1 putative HAD-like hydrolase [Neisseria weaveri]
MKNIRPSESILVLDLDDTLYPEYEYKLSGIQTVCQHISLLYPEYPADKLMAKLDTSGNDWLDQLCRLCGFNQSEKQSLLWLYRTHTPNLTAFMPSEKFKNLLKPFAACILISDGRSLTQRLKLYALGLLECFDEILISEACQSEKPDEKRFKHVQQHYSGRHYIYLGDNIAKDFITPNRLGWQTIGILPKKHNIHQHQANRFDNSYQPHIWLGGIDELPSLFTR